MQSNGSVRFFRACLATTLALAAMSLGACSAATQEDLDEVELRQDNAPAPTCPDQFKCDCEAKGGTVDGPNWCCKHDEDGSSTCTNHPEDIISWRENPPGPDRLRGVKMPEPKLDMNASSGTKPTSVKTRAAGTEGLTLDPR